VVGEGQPAGEATAVGVAQGQGLQTALPPRRTAPGQTHTAAGRIALEQGQ